MILTTLRLLVVVSNTVVLHCLTNHIIIILYYTFSVIHGPPLDFVVEVEDTSMAFTWSPPDPMLQNGNILSYTLTCTAGSETTSTVTTQLQFTLDTFIPGETFQCIVYATNAYGDGPPNNLTVTTESKNTRRMKICNSYMTLQVFSQVPLPIYLSWIWGRTKSYFLQQMKGCPLLYHYLGLDFLFGAQTEALSM